MLDVLVVAPHPDDAELGMAGALMKFKDDGFRVGVLDLTDGEPTPFGSPEIRARETAESSQIMGLDWRENLGLPNRRLEATLEARARLATVFRRVRPRWLFAAYWVDAHPDHVAATELIEAARFWSKLTKTDLAGEPFHPERGLLLLLRSPESGGPARVRPRYQPVLARKRAAIECYQSQFVTGRPQDPPTFVDRLRDEAAYWGWSIASEYGEPFACREAVGLKSLRDLK